MPATLFNATINGTAARLFSDVAWENGHRTLLPNVPLPENPMTVIEAVLAALSGLPANLAADDGDDFALVLDGAFSAAESLVPAPAAGHGGNGPAAGHVAGNGPAAGQVAGNGPAAGHVGNGQAPGLNNAAPGHVALGLGHYVDLAGNGGHAGDATNSQVQDPIAQSMLRPGSSLAGVLPNVPDKVSSVLSGFCVLVSNPERHWPGVNGRSDRLRVFPGSSGKAKFLRPRLFHFPAWRSRPRSPVWRLFRP